MVKLLNALNTEKILKVILAKENLAMDVDSEDEYFGLDIKA